MKKEQELTEIQQRNFNLIELRVINQRYVELLDELLMHNLPTNNKKLRNALKATHVMLDKETKGYNELYEATGKGTTAFYDICEANAKMIISGNILDKNLINKSILANKIDPKSLDGILNKILK